MANTPSLLDPGQIIKQAYNDSKQSIRVDAQISAPDGTSVLIDATTDSIRIGNSSTGPFLNINSDGTTDTKNITGTISLPTNAAQETGGHLASIDSKLTDDGSGNVKVNLQTSIPAGSNTIGAVNQAGAPWSQNLTQIGGSIPSATNSLPAQISTSGAYVSSSNPFPTNDISNGTNGSTIPSTGIQIGGSDGSKFRTMLMTPEGMPIMGNAASYYTGLGKVFSIDYDQTLSDTNEHPMVYFVNPGTNTKAFIAAGFYVAANASSGILVVRVYINPTVTANGTLLASHNGFISASAPSSTMNVYNTPTVTSNGTKVTTMITAGNTSGLNLPVGGSAIMVPGNSILVTAQATNLGGNSTLQCHFNAGWIED